MSKQANRRPIGAYADEVHGEDLAGVHVGAHGYKFRELEGLVVPPYVTPSRYAASRRIQLREGDVCYCSYPKSGSTWLAHIITLILNGAEPPAQGTLRSGLHWLESSWTYPRTEAEVEALPSPRIFKSHMPHRMALGGGPKGSAGKFVYIARNPKDVAVSYYFFEREKAWTGHYQGTWEQWLDLYLAGRAQRGDWFDHVLSWWSRRDLDNLLFLKYESLLGDFPGELARLARFLGYELDAEQIDRIADLTSFETMREDSFANMHEIEDFQGFFRRGKVGSWRAQFTAEQDARMSRLIDERLGGTGLVFEYE